MDAGGVISIWTVKPRSLDVTRCGGGAGEGIELGMLWLLVGVGVVPLKLNGKT